MRRRLPLLTISDDERAALIRLRDHASVPYQRERAAALLKLADGATIQQVAETGLHKVRTRKTVATWLKRYLDGAWPDLSNRPGRGRKPAFSPSAPGRHDGQDAPQASAHP